MKSCFLSLKPVFNLERCNNDPYITMYVAELDNLFSESSGIAVATPVVNYAVEALDGICNRLMFVGKYDILEDYLGLKGAQKSEIVKLIAKGRDRREALYIAVLQLEEKVSLDRCTELWVAVNHIEYAAWCWNTPSSYFENRPAPFKDVNFLYDQSNWAEMNRIRTRSSFGAGDMRFFTREQCKRLVNIIVSHFVVAQAASTDPEVLQALELRLEESGLVLIVDSTEPELDGVYIIKRFNEQGITTQGKLKKAAAHQVLESIIEAGDDGVMDLAKFPFARDDSRVTKNGKKKSKSAASYVSYYLDKLKIGNELRQVFFNEITKRTMRVRSTRVMLENVPGINSGDLRKHIKELKKID